MQSRTKRTAVAAGSGLALALLLIAGTTAGALTDGADGQPAASASSNAQTLQQFAGFDPFAPGKTTVAAAPEQTQSVASDLPAQSPSATAAPTVEGQTGPMLAQAEGQEGAGQGGQVTPPQQGEPVGPPPSTGNEGFSIFGLNQAQSLGVLAGAGAGIGVGVAAGVDDDDDSGTTTPTE